METGINEVTQLLHNITSLKISICRVNIFSLIFKNYRLNNQNEFKKILSYSSKKNINKNKSKLEDNCLVVRKIQKKISHFFSILSKKENLNVDLIAHNLKKTFLKEKLSVVLVSDNFNKNNYGKSTIMLMKDIYLINPLYEFLRMSSTNYPNHGFCSYNVGLETSIGLGLDKGYTELLNNIYFGLSENCHATERIIAYELEKIIGLKMREYYFNADLDSLINDLLFYETRENIIIFIKNLDSINNNCCSKQNIVNIYKFLLNIYIKKIENDLRNRTIEDKEVYNILYSFLIDLSFINIISNEIKANNVEINKIIKEIHNQIKIDLAIS